MRDQQANFAAMDRKCIPALVFASRMGQTVALETCLYVKKTKSLFARVARGLATILHGARALRDSLIVRMVLSAMEEAGFVETVPDVVALHPAAIHQTRHSHAVIKPFVIMECGTAHDRLNGCRWRWC